MKPLVDIREAAGKTIERTTFANYGYVAIHYTDGSASIMEASEDGIEHYDPKYYQPYGVMVELGLCSKEEHKEFTRKVNDNFSRSQRGESSPIAE